MSRRPAVNAVFSHGEWRLVAGFVLPGSPLGGTARAAPSAMRDSAGRSRLQVVPTIGRRKRKRRQVAALQIHSRHTLLAQANGTLAAVTRLQLKHGDGADIAPVIQFVFPVSPHGKHANDLDERGTGMLPHKSSRGIPRMLVAAKARDPGYLRPTGRVRRRPT